MNTYAQRFSVLRDKTFCRQNQTSHLIDYRWYFRTTAPDNDGFPNGLFLKEINNEGKLSTRLGLRVAKLHINILYMS